MKTETNSGTPLFDELLRKLTELSGRISNLETRFEDCKKFLYGNVAEIQKTLDEVKHPDVHYSIVRR